MSAKDPKVEFIRTLYCPARKISKETGMSWELMLSQAAQETGWGQKVLPETNNIFNIKADRSWSGPKKKFHVHEFKGGKKVWVDDDFRVYATIQEALRDRVQFLKQNPRYAKAGLFDPDTLGDLVEEARALKAGGYATDPAYAEALAQVFRGRTMQKAIAEAQRVGCDCCSQNHQVTILDAAKNPLKNQKVRVASGNKSIELTTNEWGTFAIKASSSMSVLVEVWDHLKGSWDELSAKLSLNKTSQSHTLIAPTVFISTKSDHHDNRHPASRANGSSSTPSTTQSTHQVSAGETLGSIGKKYGVSYQGIAAANHITSPFTIYIGQRLVIPKTMAPQGEEHSPPPRPAPHIQSGSSAGNHPQVAIGTNLRAPWLAHAERERTLGVHRGGGQLSDTHIKEYATATTMGQTNDATYAYCAAFANWCLTRAGFAGNRSAMAVSFRNWGRSTKQNRPAYGALALIKFPGGGHHVTFVVGKTSGNRIATLGGNQGGNHAVSQSAVPAAWVIAYRLPSNYPDREEDYALQDIRHTGANMSHASTH